MKKVIDVVRDYLLEIGADGLCTHDGCCGCDLDDLAPCLDNFSDCIPAKKSIVEKEIYIPFEVRND